MIPISQAKIKFVQSLKRKKYRLIHNAYVLEGVKACETATAAGLQPIFGVTKAQNSAASLFRFELFTADETSMKALTTLSTTPDLMCVFPLPDPYILDSSVASFKTILFLDRIQDPGNLGTIIRTADWYGVELICLNKGCVDVFNPKSLQAAMGSHVNMSFLSIEIDQLRIQLGTHKFVGLDMDGQQLDENLVHGQSIVLVIGNEGQGLSTDVRQLLDLKVKISGANSRVAESLNAAIATAISLDRICLR